MCCYSPVCSWIGVEVGYLQATIKSTHCLKCSNKPGLLDDPFVMVVQSIRKFVYPCTCYPVQLIVLFHCTCIYAYICSSLVEWRNISVVREVLAQSRFV